MVSACDILAARDHGNQDGVDDDDEEEEEEEEVDDDEGAVLDVVVEGALVPNQLDDDEEEEVDVLDVLLVVVGVGEVSEDKFSESKRAKEAEALMIMIEKIMTEI